MPRRKYRPPLDDLTVKAKDTAEYVLVRKDWLLHLIEAAGIARTINAVDPQDRIVDGQVRA